MHVAEQADVGEAVVVADEELAPRHLRVQQCKHVVCRGATTRRIRLVRLQTPGDEPETQSTDRGNDVRLLEEEPAVDLRITREEGCPLGEMEEDCIRLREEDPGWILEHRRGARRIDRRELVGQRVAAEDVDRNAFVPAAELRQQ